MPVGQAIIPRYLYIAATATAQSYSTTPATPSAASTTACLNGLEVEGLEKILNTVTTKVEDGQEMFDRFEISASGFVRGIELASSLTSLVNKPSSTSINKCDVYMVGAPNTLGLKFRNVALTVVTDFSGNKTRTKFSLKRDSIYDANEATGTGGGVVEVFTSSGS